MKKPITAIILILMAATAAFACADRQPIYGRALRQTIWGTYALHRVRVTVTAEGFAGAAAVTNPFGFYAMTVPACNAYEVAAFDKAFEFTEPMQQVILPVPDADGGVQVDFVSIEVK